MSFTNSILCKVCNGIDFEPANGAFYCQSCGTESREHGQDFIYEETCLQYAEPSEVCEYSDSNDENHDSTSLSVNSSILRLSQMTEAVGYNLDNAIQSDSPFHVGVQITETVSEMMDSPDSKIDEVGDVMPDPSDVEVSGNAVGAKM